MVNVIQFILADEAVVEEDVDTARKTVRAKLTALGGARLTRDNAQLDRQDDAHARDPGAARPGRTAGESEWKVGTPSEPGSVPKPMPKYTQEQAGPVPFPGLAPPVG
jgi:hypothetical protein